MRGPGAPRTPLAALGWVIVAGLGLLALLRLVAWDSVEPLIVLNALTMFIYLPAWVVAAWALIVRRWWLGLAAVVIVAAQLAFVVPEFAAAAALPAWTAHASVVRVFDANVDQSEIFNDGYVKAIEQQRPDVIALEEFTPQALWSMKNSGVLASYPYQCTSPTPGATGFLVASKLRLTDCQIKNTGYNDTSMQYMQYMVEATLSTPAGPVALRVVHPLAPFPSYWREYKTALADINQSVRASGDSTMLMVGDFNSTWNNRGFSALLHDGLTDGAAARGKVLDMTWPNGAILPPFVRIDHVLTGSDLAVTQIASGPGFGSDHRYLTASVAIRS
jgi:endonuclease/exonuclease/phosphatase (EEP) superfamily protein YafD